MFNILGESIQEIILRKVTRAKSFGILADEAANVAVLQQLIVFLTYVNPEIGKDETGFLFLFEVYIFSAAYSSQSPSPYWDVITTLLKHC